MLNIKSMRIRLPAGYEHRASFIANMVGESLAGYSPVKNMDIERLSIEPLRITPETTDGEIAGRIAEQIIDALGRRI